MISKMLNVEVSPPVVDRDLNVELLIGTHGLQNIR